MKTLHWFIIFILVFCMMGVRDMIFAVAVGGLVENALSGDISSLTNYLYLLGGAAVISVPLQMLVAYAAGRFGVFGTRNLFLGMFPRLGRVPEAVYERDNTANLQSRMTDDVSRVLNFFTSGVHPIIWTTAYGLIPLLYLFYLNPFLALLSYTVLPVMFMGINRIMKALDKLTKEVSAAQAQALQVAQETITQIESVKSYGLDGIMLERYRLAQAETLKLFKRRKMREALSSGINTLSYMLPTLIMVLLGVYLMTRGQIAISGLIIFTQLGSSGQWFILSLSDMIAEVRRTNGYLARIYEAVDEPPERVGGEVPSADAQEILRLSDVSFRYEGRAETLQNLSFSIRRGETVALVGESGSGKSTVFKLLEGFYVPDSGSLSVFERDIARVDLRKLRDLIAIVPQDPFFITGTLRENLIFDRSDVSDGDLLGALATAGLRGIEEIWPDGLDTRVAEKGANLSGGQRQRIAIARAILRGAPVLLFDEVTSALDYQTEREVYESIQGLQGEHTMLIISHRLSFVKSADRILVLRDGGVHEEGSHEELMRLDGVYAAMNRLEGEGGAAS